MERVMGIEPIGRSVARSRARPRGRAARHSGCVTSKERLSSASGAEANARAAAADP
jgi:hypothetical protein